MAVSTEFSITQHANPPESDRRDLRWTWALATLLVVTAAVYLPILRHGFVNWDDPTEIISNPDLNPVTLKGIAWNWSHTRMTVYMPLTYTVWAGIALLARQPGTTGSPAMLNAGYFHAACLIFHLISVAAVFLIVRRLVGARNLVPAAIGAAVFALHPIQVEPVAWASGMYTLMSAALCLVAIHQYIAYTDGGRRARAHFAVATIAFLLAVLSKPTAIVLPLMVAAIDATLLRRDWRALVRPIGFWLVISVCFFLVARRFHAASNLNTSLLLRPLIALDAIWFYLCKIVLPWDLILDYGRWPGFVAGRVQTWFTWIVPAVLIIAAVMLRKRRPLLTAAIALFMLGLVPYLGLAKFDYQWFSTVADRYAYLAMLGVAVAVATVLSDWPSHRATIAAIAIVAFLAARSRAQVRYWSDTRKLFEHTLVNNPGSLVAHTVLASQAVHDRRAGDAEDHFRRAIAARADDPTANFNYGNFLRAHGRLEEAAERYRAVIAKQPADFKAHNSLGATLAQLGRLPESAVHLIAAIELADQAGQDYADAHLNLGLVLVRAGDDRRAIAQFHAALSANPHLEPARRALVAAQERASGASTRPR